MTDESKYTCQQVVEGKYVELRMRGTPKSDKDKKAASTKCLKVATNSTIATVTAAVVTKTGPRLERCC